MLACTSRSTAHERPHRTAPHRTAPHRTALHFTGRFTGLHLTWTRPTAAARCGASARALQTVRGIVAAHWSSCRATNVGWAAATAGTLPWYINTIVEIQENQQTDAAEQEETQKDPMSYCPSPVYALTRARTHAHARTHACMGAHVPRWFVCHSVPIYRSDAAVRRTVRCRYWEDEFARLNQLAYYNMCHFKVGRCCAVLRLS